MSFRVICPLTSSRWNIAAMATAKASPVRLVFILTLTQPISFCSIPSVSIPDPSYLSVSL